MGSDRGRIGGRIGDSPGDRPGTDPGSDTRLTPWQKLRRCWGSRISKIATRGSCRVARRSASRAPASGTRGVRVGSSVLQVAEREPIAPGSDVYACIRAEDVTLETDPAGKASARNHLVARVVGIVSEGPIDRVALDCGFALDAL